MYLRLLNSLKSAHKLVYYFVVVTSYSLLVCNNVQAYEQAIKTNQDLFDNVQASKQTIKTNRDLFDNVQASKPTIKTNQDLFNFDDIYNDQLVSRVAIDPKVDQPVTQDQPQRSMIVAQIANSVPAISLPDLPRTVSPESTEIRPLSSNLGSILIPTPNNIPAVPLKSAPISPQQESSSDPRYLITPQALSPQEVDPFSTQFVLNGDRVSHLTTTNFKSGYESGNFRSSDLNFNIYQLFHAQNVQSVTADRVLRVNTKLEVGGARSISKSHDIAVAVAQPQTLLGVRQQISLDANCLDNSGRVCTYLPGLTIDDSVINQRKLQPFDVKVTSQFGDVIAPTAVTAIRKPGFQGGTSGQGAPSYGLDLYFPAVGIVSPEGAPPPILTGERREDLSTEIAANYTRLNQDFATNGKESTLGRTIRSVNYINGDRNQLVNFAVQALGQVLPEFQPQIAPGQPGAKIVVNPNLFRAANALRIPDQSLTVYQGGTGAAASHGDDPRIPPGASHQALWVGLSPVMERKFERDYYYKTLRSPVIVSSGGGEGGNVPVDINLNGVNFTSGALQNAYAQGYVTVYNRDVDRYDVETIRQSVNYYPHVSLTGVSLTENTLWRYFGGAIFNMSLQPQTTQDIKAYIGTDYSIVNPHGFSFSVGGVGYLNPDPEHYTQLFANATQAIPLGSNQRDSLVVGVNANYVADGLIKIQSLPVRSAQSSVNLGVTANFGDISVGGTQFLGNLLPDAIESKTLFNVGWKISDRLNLGAFYTPFDQSVSTSPWGANLSFTIDPESNSKIYMSWNTAEIDFRRTLGAKANIFRDNTFSVSFRHQF